MHSSPPDTQREAVAQAAAVSAGNVLRPRTTTSVTYQSRGCVLVIGEATRVRELIPQIAAPLRVVAFVSGTGAAAPAPSGVTWVVGRIVKLSGYLGRYAACSQGADGKQLDCGPFSVNADGFFDLVLDLGSPPLIATEVPPLGYFAPGVDSSAVTRALTDLPRFVGEHSKPKYFDYEAEICVHGAKDVVGCQRCLAACPAGAIVSQGDRVEFDPFLCQGCGSCATVCPTGAVRYTRPGPDEVINRLRVELTAFREAGGVAPVIAVFGESSAAAVRDIEAPSILPFQLHGMGALGPETWLAALAYGALRVLLVVAPEIPRTVVGALRQEIEVCQALLSAVGDNPQRVTLIDVTEPDRLRQLLAADAVPQRPSAWPSPPSLPEGKHARMLALLDHLKTQSPENTQAVPLVAGASFGALTVATDACTVCHACVNLCPTGALEAGAGSELELLFTEECCVQCGLCTAGCPEHALALAPRLELAPERRRSQTVIARGEMFPCTECGTPFISRAVLERSLQHIKDHPFFTEGGTDFLKLCMTCRQKRMLTT